MTKASNTIAYKLKSPLSLDDYAFGTNAENNFPGLALKQNISMKLSEMRALFLAGLDPETGGQLKVTEIEIDTLDTDIATTVNAITPAYEVLAYELVFFTVEDRIYLLRSTNVTIGSGEDALSNTDFIAFPVSVGPAGANGTDGTDGREVEFQVSVTHIQWRYVGAGSWTNLIALADLKGDTGATGATGATGPTGPAGTTSIGNGLTTRVTGAGTSGSPYVTETFNQQRTNVTTSFTLANSDDQSSIFVNNGASDITITVPANLKDNFVCGFWQRGSGDVTFIEDTGTTIETAIGLKIKGQGYFVVLEKVTNTATYYLGNATKA